MKRNIFFDKQKLIVFGVLLTVTFSVSSVIAYVYYKPSSKSISQRIIVKENVQPVSEKRNNRSGDIAREENVSPTDRVKNHTPASESYRKTDTGEKYNNDSRYASNYKDRKNSNGSSYSDSNINDHERVRSSRSSESIQSNKSTTVRSPVNDNTSIILTQRSTGSIPNTEAPKKVNPENSLPVEDNIKPVDSSSVKDEEPQEPDAEDPDSADTLPSNVSVSRKLNNVSGSSVDVNLTINVGDNVPTGLIIEESVPAGWNASNISQNGSFTASTNKIRWLFYGSTVKSGSVSYKLESSGPDNKLSLSGMYFFMDKNNKNVTQQIQ